MTSLRNRNTTGLRGWDVVDDIAAQCFTQEQREALEYTQGTQTITVADQLAKHYGPRLCTWDKPTTLKNAAQIVKDFELLINDIETKTEELKEIRSPDAWRQTTHGSQKSDNSSESTTLHDSNGRSVSLNTNASHAQGVQTARAFTSNPTKLIKLTETYDDRGELRLPLDAREVKTLRIDAQGVATIVKQTASPKLPAITTPATDYHSQGFNRALNRSQSWDQTDGESVTTTKDKSENKGTAVSNLLSDSAYEIRGKSIEKALRSDLIRLRLMFFNKFLPLFSDVSACVL